MLSNHSASLILSSSLPTRCLAAIPDAKSRHIFAIGTCSPSASEGNEVHFIEYNEEDNAIYSCGNVGNVCGEINSLEVHSQRQLAMLCTSSKTGETSCSLMKFNLPLILTSNNPEEDTEANSSNEKLSQVANLPTSSNAKIGKLRRVLWHPEDKESNGQCRNNERLVSLHDSGMIVWDLIDSQFDNIGELVLPADKSSRMHATGWNPHDVSEVSLACDSSIQTVDIRSMEVSCKIKNAHGMGFVRDIDYNPNKPYYMLSGGEDRHVKVWDLRHPAAPVKVMTGVHSHWVCQTKYNQYYDQLVLSTGTDSLAALYRVTSVSSTSYLRNDVDNESTEKYSNGENEISLYNDLGSTKQQENVDTIVKLFDDHDDSVYAAAWSASDAWVFATLSFDSKLVVNRVPSTEKYNILL